MKKNIKYILIVASAGIIIWLVSSFLAISWISYFSNPKRIEELPKEKILFYKLKNEYGFSEIKRTPETEKKLLHPKDTLSYELYISYIDCNLDKVKYQKIADSISVRINRDLNLDLNFYKYNLTFYCDNGVIPSYKYSYLRKNIR